MDNSSQEVSSYGSNKMILRSKEVNDEIFVCSRNVTGLDWLCTHFLLLFPPLSVYRIILNRVYSLCLIGRMFPAAYFINNILLVHSYLRLYMNCHCMPLLQQQS